MPLTAKGREILRSMTKQYGEKRGKSVFYASKNKGTITGVDEGTPEAAPNRGTLAPTRQMGKSTQPISGTTHQTSSSGLHTAIRGVGQGIGRFLAAGAEDRRRTRDVEQEPPALREIADIMEEEYAGRAPRSVICDAIRHAARGGMAADRVLRHAVRDVLSPLYDPKPHPRGAVPALPRGRLESGDRRGVRDDDLSLPAGEMPASSVSMPPGTVDKRHFFLGAVRDCVGSGMAPHAALVQALSRYAERGTHDAWEEGKHPRGAGGKFGRGTGAKTAGRGGMTPGEEGIAAVGGGTPASRGIAAARKDARVRTSVHEALNNALENGYTDVTHTWSPERTAEDLRSYDADLEDVDAAELIPLIKEWRQKNSRKTASRDAHEGFAKLERGLAHEKGIRDPAGLAAAIGRKKMGKAAFQRKAAAGR